MNFEKLRIPVDKLRRICSRDEFDFCKTTVDVSPLDGFIVQERAVRAMQFGLAMNAPGYNIFVVGPSGTGKGTYTQAVVSQVAAGKPAPDDWCYIHNFNDQDRPMAVSLPAGEGYGFQKDMEELVADLRVAIPKAFEDGDYEQQKSLIIESVQQEMDGYFQALEQEARESGLNVKQTQRGVVFIPLKDNKPIPPEEFDRIPVEERHKIEEKGRRLQKKFDETLHTGRVLEKQAKEKIEELEKQIALFAAGPIVDRLLAKYDPFPPIVEYLREVLRDITKNTVTFKNQVSEPAVPSIPVQIQQDDVDQYTRYKVNLFVTNNKNAGAPVITEPSTSYYNIFGKVEYRSHVLSSYTDFTMVKPGAIHRANGGYLILQAKDVLSDPLTWDTLKKAIKYRQAKVENIGEQYRLVPNATLRPEPIPFNAKVILIGSPHLYQLLYSIDEDFQKLFKVKVDFDTEMPRTPENLRKYASFVSTVCREDNLIHFDWSGLGKLTEYGSYLAGHQDKLSTRFNEVIEIVYEAAAFAQIEGSSFVESSHVQKAIKERRYRSSRIEEKFQELIINNSIMIDTQGCVVGQVNGLAVSEFGGYVFGRPVRITARTYLGRGGIINIEREAQMSGSIHSKGILILAGYLGGKFAQKKPLGITAQITFEQLYDGVEGDSASSAELYAILSSLSGLPLKQCLAVTGSVNQFGEIQPIGGATEKIEGFFDICKARGLSGEQGVIIPIQNLENLMLKEEILDAVNEGKFHIYAVKDIEEGIELLSGVAAGKMMEDGTYPKGSVMDLVEQKINENNN
ncbi:MAG: Lon protease [Pelotomaculum sp. PtaB.Bin013]|uniref:endopeptidase La n=1 Tax=Pelotomaculum isophthalicicum JI TaxID=947010 RepID=A0A9X4H5W0_9FIRM|nr:ATP-binding protein [Pelotomaculum isophthalicicum]MDF9409978.1 AAA family ATPase [Pelotomaculum isophthalicicum JI]OPX92263.1 MAG: Lon protease [Pelotomaculum sp. PtaB.Bin013]